MTGEYYQQHPDVINIDMRSAKVSPLPVYDWDSDFYLESPTTGIATEESVAKLLAIVKET